MPLDPVAFEPYADPDDFIREVTDLIWVNRSIGHIWENYEPDSIVHGAYGTSVGVDEVVAGTLMRVATTPDRVGQAEDVIWEARGDDAFLSSHLVLSADPAVGFIHRTIANCLYRRGRMVEEWVVRDSLAIALQVGEDPDAVAREKGYLGYSGSMTEAPPTDVLAVGDSGPRPDDFRAETAMVLEMIDQVWNGRDLNAVERYFARDLTLHTIGYRTFLRPENYRRALLQLLRPFPTGRFEVRDLATNDDPRYAGLRIAVTWVFKGRYNGVADFGPLTGTPVEILGISQFLVQGGRIVREVRLYDEIAVRTQIAVQRGDTPYDSTNIY
ncbi:ester cyclase [uncultured Friedmanniella sp.]|uniref:nuclear transport factor 2 family protein n=1 Tax=uncultured Friedmanniella sp. TaxID=335381 RepID=UPI0035CB300D